MVKKYSAEIEDLMRKQFKSHTEKRRRYYAAEEAMKLGRGGISYIAKLFSIERNTVALGMKELVDICKGCNEIDYRRQRKVGGGRKKKLTS